MLKEEESWIAFSNNIERLNKLKEWGLTPKTFDSPKPVYYKDFRQLSSPQKFILCDVLGWAPHPFIQIAVIDYGNGPYKICVDYLKELQPTQKEVKNTYG